MLNQHVHDPLLDSHEVPVHAVHGFVACALERLSQYGEAAGSSTVPEERLLWDVVLKFMVVATQWHQ